VIDLAADFRPYGQQQMVAARNKEKMMRSKHTFLRVVAAAILAVAATSYSPVAAQTPGRTGSAQTLNGQAPILAAQDVNVVNTPTVTIGNTPWVNIGNLPTVTLGTTAVAVKDQTNGAFQPYTNTLVSTNNYTFTVPSGKRLVIEHVSGSGYISSGQKFLETGLKIAVLINGVSQAWVVQSYSPTFMGTQAGGLGNLDIYSISTQTKAYVEPGGTVETYFEKTGGVAGVSFTVVGYLVDVQ
jgi:hypothetical protein